ncbi:MAG TPA: dTDP-glucose 4,6-dehydratase [Coprothermobacter sp.]|nr:dTDP-glucose 4,6-dehydratase [Coprothermobacter sp.]
MRMLITGGAGFIGSEFVRQAVRKGHQVAVVDKLTYAGDLERLSEVRKDITFYKADISNQEFIEHIFEKEDPEVVVHFAAESHVDRSLLDPYPFISSNVLGTQVLLEVSKAKGVELFVNMSTDEVYGDLGKEGSFTEDSPLKPNSPYSTTKASADMLGRAYHRSFGLPVITIRASNNYGPWQYPEKFVPVIILKALRDEKIPVYGDGTNVREWLYVTDCAEGIMAAIDRGNAGEIYNIGSKEEKQNIEVVKAILKLLGKGEELIEFVKDRPGHDFRYSLDSVKAKRELGWEAKTSFDEGIKKTVEWYVEHLRWAQDKVAYLNDYWKRVYVRQ